MDISVTKVFISLRLLLFRYESHIQNPTFPFFSLFIHSEKKDTSCFIQKRKTHPVSFRNERHILYPNYTLPVFQNSSLWIGKATFFYNGSYPFVYFDAAQTFLPFLFFVFHFEAKDTSSPIVLLPFHLSFLCLVFLIFLT